MIHYAVEEQGRACRIPVVVDFSVRDVLAVAVDKAVVDDQAVFIAIEVSRVAVAVGQARS